jgi:Pentapeptide repeats (8 copies)
MVSGPKPTTQDQWKPHELDLREREVRYGGLVGPAEAIIGISAILATLIAGYAAVQAGQAVKIAAKGIEQQANETRLTTAISSIGADQAAERVAGFSLLRRHVQDQVTAASSEEERRDAYDLYTSALDVLENYLRNPPALPAASATAGAPAGRGYGIPRIPPDNVYAADELRALLNLKPAVDSLHIVPSAQRPPPSVDLTNVQLFGQSWARINFAWLGGHYLPGIDLRGANLSGSVWGGSTLDRAYLQCANLATADLRGTHLNGADLRGADLTGADLTGAELEDAKLDGATGLAKVIGLDRAKLTPPAAGISRAQDGADACLRNQRYWAPQPPAASR